LTIFFAKFFIGKNRKKIAKPGRLGLDCTFLNRELFCAAHLITCSGVNILTDVDLKQGTCRLLRLFKINFYYGGTEFKK